MADLLPLDHVPLHVPSLAALTEALETLGFAVSPIGAYLAPDGQGWPSRRVAFTRGWLDLIELVSADRPSATPRSCLFWSQDLDAGRALASRRIHELVHRFDQAAGQSWRCAYVNLKQGLGPLGVALIRYDSGRSAAEDVKHPNGSIELVGLGVVGPAPPLLDPLRSLLELGGFEWRESPLAPAFGATSWLRVRVLSLRHLAEYLSDQRVTFSEVGGGLVAGPLGALGCPIHFIE